MTKWEYHVIGGLNEFRQASDAELVLNQFGDEGWELVALDPTGPGHAWLKRPRPPETYTITFEGKPCDCLAPKETIVCRLDEPGLSELSVAGCCCAGLDEDEQPCCDGECGCG